MHSKQNAKVVAKNNRSLDLRVQSDITIKTIDVS